VHRALAEGYYAHLHNQVASTVYQEMVITCGQSNAAQMTYEYKQKSVLQNSIYYTMTDP